jgi:hypothetical protein
MFPCFYIQNITRNCFYSICMIFPVLELLFWNIFDKTYLHIVLILHLHSTVSIKRWVVAYPFDALIDLGYQTGTTLINQGQYSKS